MFMTHQVYCVVILAPLNQETFKSQKLYKIYEPKAKPVSTPTF